MTNAKPIAKQDIELGIDGAVILKTTYVDGSVEYKNVCLAYDVIYGDGSAVT